MKLRPRLNPHDSLAFDRQGHLARLLLAVNVVVAALAYAITAVSGEWSPALSGTQLAVFLGLWITSLAALLLAADGVQLIMNPGLNRGPAQKRATPDFFARHRRHFYYAGVFANVAAVAVLVEMTGGVVSSPFVTVFFAIVLTGQQLSRFRTQSKCLIAAGVACTLGMLAAEAIAQPSGDPAPYWLYVALMTLALLAGGAITHAEKGDNYAALMETECPSHAHVYRDGARVWHFALYCKGHTVDPVLAMDGDWSPNGKVPEALIARLREEIDRMTTAASWQGLDFEQREVRGEDYVIDFRVRE